MLKRADKSRGQLKLCSIAIDTYRENVAEGFQALSNIEISANDNTILAILNVVDDNDIIAPGELDLSVQGFEKI